LQPEFWHKRWRNDQIGFHQPSVDRNLIRHWPALDLAHGLDKGARVFVPLCGKSLDMLWLQDQGYPVVGVELSTIALEAFCMENGVPARRRVLDRFDVYEAANLQLFRGDFFALTRALLGEVAAVYDRAALISWTEELRVPYVSHLAALMRPGTPMLLIALEYPQAQMSGPPFSVPREEVARLYSRHFEIREIDRQDILAHESRLRARGVTELVEVCYQMVRL
jgi:thiopurine S-methyltransferase